MADGGKKLITEQLSKLKAEDNLKLVFHMKQQAPEGEPPSPGEFASRTDYRRALIDYRSTANAKTMDVAVKKLERLGLKTKPKPLADSVIVEGSVRQLLEGLSDNTIESASFDDQLSLPEIKKE